MKKRNIKKASPEEAFLRSAEERMDIGLDYGQIKDQLDTEEIARVGAARQAATADTFAIRPAAAKTARGPSATVVLASVLAVVTAVGFGGFLIAKQAGQNPPPAEDPHGRPPLTESVEIGEPGETSDENVPDETSDENIPGETSDETYRNPDPNTGLDCTDPEETLPPLQPLKPLNPQMAGILGDATFDLTGSYATENILSDPNSSLATQYTLFLRMDHLPVSNSDEKLPTMLWVEEQETWEGLFPHLSCDTYEDYSVLDVSLREYDSWFFDHHSLLILFTEGRSGSIRYRVDELVANNTYVRVAMTAGVPAANTMDIAYWCIIIPVDKPQRGDTNRPVYLEVYDEPMDSFEEFVTLAPEVYRGLWFSGSLDGSYERDGYLYGRIGLTTEKWSWDFPRAETVTSFEEWQTVYGGYAVYGTSDPHIHKAFHEGLNDINEEFFTQKTLLVVYLDESSGTTHHCVDSVVAENGTLTVRISSLTPAMGTDDMGYWAILIPIDKEFDSLPVTVERSDKSLTWEEWEALPENQNWEEWNGD